MRSVFTSSVWATGPAVLTIWFGKEGNPFMGIMDRTWTRTFHLTIGSHSFVGLIYRSGIAIRKDAEGKENREWLQPVAPLPESKHTRSQSMITEGMKGAAGEKSRFHLPRSVSFTQGEP
jgi:hypothetical protein